MQLQTCSFQWLALWPGKDTNHWCLTMAYHTRTYNHLGACRWMWIWRFLCNFKMACKTDRLRCLVADSFHVLTHLSTGQCQNQTRGLSTRIGRMDPLAGLSYALCRIYLLLSLTEGSCRRVHSKDPTAKTIYLLLYLGWRKLHQQLGNFPTLLLPI